MSEFTTVTNGQTPFDAPAVVQNTSIMTMEEDNRFIADLTSATVDFCSFIPKTEEERAILFNIMNNPEKRISDCINMNIKVKDLYVEVVQLTNSETGEIQSCPRIVAIDENGVGYQAVSIGIYSAFKKLIRAYGAPTWNKPLELKVVQVTKGERKMLTFNVVSAPKKSKK